MISKYENAFFECGIKLEVSKKYCEEAVQEDTHENHGLASLLVDRFINIFARRAEKAKGYNRIRNRYHCLVISIVPIDKSKVPKDMCKEYSFFLKKIERKHIGLSPDEYISKERKLLEKIENRILSILKKAKRNGVKKVCHDTVLDAFRYFNSKKYKYKKRILGKEIWFWHIVNIIVIGLLVTILLVMSLVLFEI